MKLFADIRSGKIIVLKGFLFLVVGLMSGGLLLSELKTLQNAALLVVCVWAFCRFYYFLFYVLEHYVSRDLKYAGLLDALRRLSARNRADRAEKAEGRLPNV